MVDKDVDQLGCQIAKEVNANLLTSMVKCPNLSAKVTKDIMVWLEDYEIAALASNWSDDQKLKRLPVFLNGPARSFYNLEISKKQTWEDAERALI